MKSLRKLHTGKPYVQFERRTEASVRATLRASSDPSATFGGFNWRYDSGLVAGLVPCAGGNCSNGPAGSASVVDTSIIRPDQQFQAGLFCGPLHARYSDHADKLRFGVLTCALHPSTARR